MGENRALGCLHTDLCSRDGDALGKGSLIELNSFAITCHKTVTLSLFFSLVQHPASSPCP